MGILQSFFSLFTSRKKKQADVEHEEKVRAIFKARGDHFKALLSANKKALEAMTTLEEAMRGEYFFSMSHVRAYCTIITVNVYHMITHLNALTKNIEHKELFDKHKLIRARIEEAVAPKVFSAGGPLVMPLKEAGFACSHEVGDKMASLGEAWQKLSQPIPDGFVVTASGFRHFLEANNLQEEISRLLQVADLSQLDTVFLVSEQLQSLITAAPVPEDLAVAMMKQYGKLVEDHGSVRLAVRSSAIGEDSPGSSFAGQYATELNVTGDNLLDVYKQVVASKYGVTAITYRFNHGIPDDEIPMCVGCLRMVDAASGGVVYSADPVLESMPVTINAVFGLPKPVVDGSGEVDLFQVDRHDTTHILKQQVHEKKEKAVCCRGTGITLVPLREEERTAASITPQQIQELAELALRFEEFYGLPQDIEWAYDEAGVLMVLQSRPLQRSKHREEKKAPLPEDAVLLLEEGICASSGCGSGEIYTVLRDEDMLQFPEGAILLVSEAHSRWAPVLSKASGVIAAVGGTAGHLASVAREYGVPAILGAKEALRLLEPGQLVTIDADSCRIFSGKVQELLARKPAAFSKIIFASSPVYSALAKAMNHIAPLRLLYPEAPTFAPAFCETMHDLTRFCHEKAVEEMFRLDEQLFSGRCGKQLCYKGSKLQYFVVNLGSGFCLSIEDKYIDIDDICCVPMLALWEGMIAVPWAGPPAASVRGFFSVMAESAANPDLEVTSSSLRMTRNYFMIDKEYCNLQASFGYHFCTVEAQAGTVEQENYVSFHFKGGAANLERRRRRVQVVADILAENRFIVDVKEDALSARAEAIPRKEACRLLAIIGFLLIHTRQMDAALHGEDAQTTFGDLLRKGLQETISICNKKFAKM